MIALLAIGGCIATAAYAASRRPSHPDVGHIVGSEGADMPEGAGRKASVGRLPKPRITRRPPAQTASTRAKVSFTAPQAGARFECRLDRAAWRSCRSPVLFTGLSLGRHWFSVRMRGRGGGVSETARARWTRLEARGFAIEPDLSGLSELYPGARPASLPLTIENPNATSIFVTSLQVEVAADPAGCASADNLALVQSNASNGKPLVVPAGGSLRLPAKGVRAPTIQLRDLAANQDACQGARFPLEFTGSAHG